MARFYGTLRGSSRKKATRCGTKRSGLVTHCASWAGAIRCEAYVTEDGEDYVSVEFVPWMGEGITKLIYDGPFCPLEPKEEETTT